MPMPDGPYRQSLNLRQLLVFLTIGFVSLLLWHTPFLYPIKIFVVFIHEAGHAFTTLLTGGQVVSMVVTPWQSGYVQHVGGNPLFIAAAGYIGSALFGGLLLLLSTRDEWASVIFFGLAVFFGLVTLVFVRNGFGLAVWLRDRPDLCPALAPAFSGHALYRGHPGGHEFAVCGV